MIKTSKKQGIAAIIITYILLIYFSDDVKYRFEYNTIEFIINLLITFVSYNLIYNYGSWKEKTNKINETVYYISAMISAICYIIIINLIFIIPFILNLNTEILYKLFNNNIIYTFLQAFEIDIYQDVIYRYAGIYAGLLVLAIISAKFSNKEGISKENDSNKINIDNNKGNQYDFQNLGKDSNAYLLTGEQKAGKAASIITGMKAGLIIVICRGVGELLIYAVNIIGIEI